MEEFLKHIGEELKKLGFVEAPEKTWIYNTVVEIGGGMMNINGQTFQQPGQQVKFEMKIEYIGEGLADDRVPLAEFNIEIKQDDQIALQITECFYLDLSESFIIYVKSMLGIKN